MFLVETSRCQSETFLVYLTVFSLPAAFGQLTNEAMLAKFHSCDRQYSCRTDRWHCLRLWKSFIGHECFAGSFAHLFQIRTSLNYGCKNCAWIVNSYLVDIYHPVGSGVFSLGCWWSQMYCACVSGRGRKEREEGCESVNTRLCTN